MTFVDPEHFPIPFNTYQIDSGFHDSTNNMYKLEIRNPNGLREYYDHDGFFKYPLKLSHGLFLESDYVPAPLDVIWWTGKASGGSRNTSNSPNINGMSHNKNTAIMNFITSNNIHILGYAEARLSKFHSKFKNMNYVTNKTEPTQLGMALYIHPMLSSYKPIVLLESPVILFVQFCDYFIVFLHKTNSIDKTVFYNDLLKCKRRASSNKFFMIGDYNCGMVQIRNNNEWNL
eukprot:NODE_81_length_22758_cov_0.877797.p12 type:complete len:231 gc:universal NODE_81_length_22758_cov_0.877797:1613-921(-)